MFSSQHEIFLGKRGLRQTSYLCSRQSWALVIYRGKLYKRIGLGAVELCGPLGRSLLLGVLVGKLAIWICLVLALNYGNRSMTASIGRGAGVVRAGVCMCGWSHSASSSLLYRFQGASCRLPPLYLIASLWNGRWKCFIVISSCSVFISRRCIHSSFGHLLCCR